MHKTSEATMKHLVLLLVEEEREFDHNSHQITASIDSERSWKERLELEQNFLGARWVGKPAVERRDK